MTADCLIDRNFINNEIESFGESVTVRIVTKSSYSKWGDVTEDVADTSSVKCFLNVMSQTDLEVKEGIFKAGDLRFWFKGTQTINVGDRIKYSDNWYQVEDLIPSVFGGNTLLKEVRVTRLVLPAVRKDMIETSTLTSGITTSQT